jgi:hypothetical protein
VDNELPFREGQPIDQSCYLNLEDSWRAKFWLSSCVMSGLIDVFHGLAVENMLAASQVP